MKRTVGIGFLVIIAALVMGSSAAGAAGAAPASAFGPEVALVEPAGGFVGRVALEPERGEIGAAVTVRASGLPGNQEFDLVWRK